MRCVSTKSCLNLAKIFDLKLYKMPENQRKGSNFVHRFCILFLLGMVYNILVIYKRMGDVHGEAFLMKKKNFLNWQRIGLLHSPFVEKTVHRVVIHKISGKEKIHPQRSVKKAIRRQFSDTKWCNFKEPHLLIKHRIYIYIYTRGFINKLQTHTHI